MDLRVTFALPVAVLLVTVAGTAFVVTDGGTDIGAIGPGITDDTSSTEGSVGNSSPSPDSTRPSPLSVSDGSPTSRPGSGPNGSESSTEPYVDPGDYPTDIRYVNRWKRGQPPRWLPETGVTEKEYRNTRAITYEVTRYPNAEPTEAHLEAAWELYNRSYEAARNQGWFEFEQAVEDGFWRGAGSGIGAHYGHIDHMAEPGIDPYEPDNLIYYPDPENESEKILVGYMYHQPISGDVEGEQVGGPLTVWHYHPLHLAGTTDLIREYVQENDDYGSPSEVFDRLGLEYETIDAFEKDNPTTADMLHVWFIDHPRGQFATNMDVPPEAIAEPEKLSERAFKRRAMRMHEQIRAPR